MSTQLFASMHFRASPSFHHHYSSVKEAWTAPVPVSGNVFTTVTATIALDALVLSTGMLLYSGFGSGPKGFELALMTGALSAIAISGLAHGMRILSYKMSRVADTVLHNSGVIR
jgi:hypothetical protein